MYMYIYIYIYTIVYSWCGACAWPVPLEISWFPFKSIGFL